MNKKGTSQGNANDLGLNKWKKEFAVFWDQGDWDKTNPKFEVPVKHSFEWTIQSWEEGAELRREPQKQTSKTGVNRKEKRMKY